MTFKPDPLATLISKFLAHRWRRLWRECKRSAQLVATTVENREFVSVGDRRIDHHSPGLRNLLDRPDENEIASAVSERKEFPGHRHDSPSRSVSVLGVPVSDLSTSKTLKKYCAIRATPNDQPIDLILHTPGGLVLAPEQIARALVEHKGKITVFVPHYAMSGGTLIALAADEIVIDSNAVLGQVDPQIGDMRQPRS